jgi:hypothetical protein
MRSHIRPERLEEPWNARRADRLASRHDAMRCHVCNQRTGKWLAAASRGTPEFDFYQCTECGCGWKSPKT